MKKVKRIKYAMCAVYDTETCNVGEGNETRAYPILFIDNDIRDVELYEYEPDKCDKVKFYRYETDYIERIEEYIKWGKFFKVVPIICAYNLMFDLQPLMELLSESYKITANAQSSTNVYTLDLMDKKTDAVVLRFWDTFHLEMRGLKAMGETCGIAKAVGDWDYSLVRTPETPLTEEELYYAKRDVQVIPAYLKYLLHANEWLTQDMLGSRVLTKTSIVRQMAKHVIAPLKIDKKNGKQITLEKAFMKTCEQELPNSFQVYALRKGCFRGGFVFTSANTANVVVRNVASLDVTSMHHTFINGRYVPLSFAEQLPNTLEIGYQKVVNTTLEQVLSSYYKPFDNAFHMIIRFNNIRIRKGSCFDKWGIALESQAKFKRLVAAGNDIGEDPRNSMQENIIREYGFHDRYENAEFALGKLYKADTVVMHVNEIELWCMTQVYEWDSHEIIYGEQTIKWKIPPDYVTLQSNILYEMKNDAKFINKHYKQGNPFQYPIPNSIPEGIAESLKNGTCSNQFFEAWYTSTVKGQFNGIYGTMAQDVYKPSYKCVDGELIIDEATATTKDNWEERQPTSCKVFYNYGARIVAGSRMHLVIAMELLENALGDRITITGGDTDSIKVACDYDVTDTELLDALKPIADASKKAIDACMKRLRTERPDLASNLTGIGSFDIEGAGSNTRWDYHMEGWNKARISYTEGHSHITCAGLSRPEGAYTIEDFIDELIANGNDIEEVFKNVLGYNVTVSNAIAHALEGHKPRAKDTFDKTVTDYLSNSCYVHAHESQALYPVGRVLGETVKPSNAQTVEFLQRKYGREVDTSLRYLYRTENCALIKQHTEYGFMTVMEGVSYND